jgi:hypothetical protein
MNVEESSGDGSFSCEGPLGIWGVRRLGILETVRGLRKGSISLCGSSVRGGSFFGIPKEGSGDGHHSLVRGPFTGKS